jgi:hypothetical protein
MLPDFRFVLGAILAIAVLAVTGLGLVASVRLVHEARLGPLEDGRSLAYAGHPEWNQFYDPDGARRFEGLAGRPEAPVAEARPDPAAEASPALAPPAVAPVSCEERTASIPARPEPEIVPVVAPVTADDRTPEAEPPHADPPLFTQAPAAVTVAAPPAEPADAPAVPGTAVPDAPPPAERAAGAPPANLVPEKQAPAQEPAQPHTAANPPDRTSPAPRARPKTQLRKKIARAHVRRIAPASQQTLQNSEFPTSNGAWPGYDGQLTGATAKRNAGNVSGTLWNRPQ